MVHEAKEALEAPHLVWYLVDPDSSLEHEIPVIELLERSPAPVFVLINKVDTLKGSAQLARVDFLERSVKEALQQRNIKLQGSRRISGRAQLGVRELLQESWASIPEGPFYYPDPEQLSDRPTRFFVAEKIRERLYYLLGEEIPYSCAVEIERFEEKTKPPRIEATIHVERDSQKGIVIGQGGKKNKRNWSDRTS